MTHDSEKEEKSRIKVTDRRYVSHTPEAEERPEGEGVKEEVKEGDTQPQAAETESKEAPLAEINFSTFLLSLHSQALIQMGAIPDPISKTKKPELNLAKQTIDLLDVLKNKTKGNLEKEEEKLLDDILYNCRMVFVEMSKKK